VVKPYGGKEGKTKEGKMKKKGKERRKEEGKGRRGKAGGGKGDKGRPRRAGKKQWQVHKNDTASMLISN
jgi:hypothetical protein